MPRTVRLAATLCASVAVGLGAGSAIERAAAERADTRTPPGVAASFASTMPPTDVKVLTTRELADVELTDQHGRVFTLERMRGSVVVVGFAPAPCAHACLRRLERLREVGRRLGERASGKDGGASATVEFVLVSSVPPALPDVATAPAASSPGRRGGEERWHVARAGSEDVAALRGRFGIVEAAPGAIGGDRPTVHLLDTAGRLVQRYRADPLDVSRLTEDVAYLRDRGS